MALLIGEKAGNHREAERIRIAVPVAVDGSDSAGNPFSEDTAVFDLNSRRAGFCLKTRVAKGAELQLVFEPACCARRKTARVARVSDGSRRQTVGVEFRN